MSIVGKTVAAVDYSSDRTEGTIRFTDGSALALAATGWEVEDLDWEELTPEQFRRRAAREQGGRERNRVRRLEGEAIMAERQRRGGEERMLIKSAFVEAIREEMLHARRAYVLDMNRATYSDPPR